MRSQIKMVAMGVLIAGSSAMGGVFEVESFHLGGFYALDDAGMPLIPDNDMSFQNYFMGRTTVGGFTTTERRTFFAFDLADVIIPRVRWSWVLSSSSSFCSAG